MTKVYLSGQIAGLTPEEAEQKFNEAAWEVYKRHEDVVIVNPMDLPPIQTSWADYLIRDLMLLKECDEIFMLKGWQNSNGAKVELAFALGLGITISYQR